MTMLRPAAATTADATAAPESGAVRAQTAKPPTNRMAVAWPRNADLPVPVRTRSCQPLGAVVVAFIPLLAPLLRRLQHHHARGHANAFGDRARDRLWLRRLCRPWW